MEHMTKAEPKSLSTRLSGMIGRVLVKSRHKSKVTMSSPRAPKMAAKDTDSNIQDLQNLVGTFFTQCQQCKAILRLDAGDEQIENWRAGSQEIPPVEQFSGLRCRNGHSTCAGCGNKPVLSGQQIFTPLGVIDHCCFRGRLFGIWILLSRFDDREMRSTVANLTPTKKKPQHRKKSSYTGTPSGVGYAGDHVNPYMQYDYMMDEDDFDTANLVPGYYHALQAGALPTIKHKDTEKSKDNLMIETLKLISKFLPLPEADATQELNLFRLSLLFDTIADLIRNDSIEDINKRRDMFLEICKFLKTIANHPGLVGLLVDGLPRKRTPGIRALGLTVGGEGFEIYNASAPSLFDASANTYRQAKMFLKLVEKTESTEDRKSSISICQIVIEVHEMLKSIIASRNPNLALDTPIEGGASADLWTRYAEENRVTFTDETLVNHRYARDFNTLVASSMKDRLNTISKEVATLTTSLPPGIFLKIADSRMDVMKVLIVGSEGSPYAGGLYIFDLFLPANYPLGPPKLSFVLEGNDNEQHSFNPNLHKGGTVCLSILNTWHGSPAEMWQPNKSTILSVLISVQAMILGAPLPWLNEPGMEVQGDTLIAQEHKYLIHMKTLKYAMIAWLENDWKAGRKEYIWKDIVQTYWKHNGNKALEYAKEWAIENPRLLKWTNIDPYAAARKKAPKSKVKGKGKGKATTLEEPSSDVEGENLIEKLAIFLGVEYQPPLQQVKQEESAENSKRKATENEAEASSSNNHILSHHTAKKQKSEDEDIETKWVYTGGRSQKEVRAVAKEFGIGHASTIKDTITKLETHVNEKGKVSSELSSKYGKLVNMAPGDYEISDGEMWAEGPDQYGPF